jgi:cell wall-associated NlpC family hydrolase
MSKKTSHATKISCYIDAMSTHSAKTARRSGKTARRTAKKGAKSARAASTKASKSARRSVGKTGKTAPRAAAAARSPSAARKPAKMIRTISPPVQPMAAHEVMIRAHKYRVGETVYYTSPTFGRAAATGSYTVVKLLPSEGDDYQYRIKSSGEAFERVAKESQLDRA